MQRFDDLLAAGMVNPSPDRAVLDEVLIHKMYSILYYSIDKI